MRDRCRTVIALVGGSPLPVYVATVGLRPEHVVVLATRASSRHADRLMAVLERSGIDVERSRVDVPAHDVREAIAAYDRAIGGVLRDTATDRCHRDDCGRAPASELMAVAAGGTKQMVVALDEWGRTPSTSKRGAFTTVHTYAHKAGFGIVRGGAMVEPEMPRLHLAELAALHGWRIEQRRSGLAALGPVFLGEHGQTVRFAQAAVVGHRLVAFNHRVLSRDRSAGRRDTIKQSAMVTAADALAVGGTYAQGCVTVHLDADDRKDEEQVARLCRELEDDLRSLWHSPSPPRVGLGRDWATDLLEDLKESVSPTTS